jgi:hypothetical protein
MKKLLLVLCSIMMTAANAEDTKYVVTMSGVT